MSLTLKQTIGIILRLIVLCFFCGMGMVNEWSGFYSEPIYAHMVIGIFYWFIVMAFLVSFIVDLDRYITHRKKIMFLPTFVGLIMILIGVVINRTRYSRVHAKNAVIAEYLGNPENENNVQFHLELKSDGNYVLYQSLHSGVITYFYYGNFTLKGNHLTLHYSKKLPGISNYLKITDETSDDRIKTLVQTNKNWQPIKGRKEFTFRRI